MALSPITTTRALTIPLSVFFLCRLFKTVCLKSLSSRRLDETLITYKDFHFLTVIGTTLIHRKRIDADIVNSWNHSPRRLAQVRICTHSCCCRHFLLNLSCSQLRSISFMFVVTGCVLDAQESYAIYILCFA